MTFTFKLSRRLALSHICPMLAVLVLVLGCTSDEFPTDSGSDPGLRDASAVESNLKRGRGRGRDKSDSASILMRISPDTATVASGAQRGFSATLKRSDGTTASDSVIWTATGGDIDARGVFTAGDAAGDYWVIAAGVTTQTADTAAIEIVTPVPPVPLLQSVVVTPASASLLTGAAQQFAVAGVAENGSSMAVTATWTATGGTVSANGFYTAGTAPGTYRVIAAAGSVADTATVTITAPPPPPPPPSATCPSGAVTLATSDNWASKVAASPSGTVFCVASGTHLNAANVVAKSNMQFIAASRRQAILDGGLTRTIAFTASGASNVVIRGLVIKRYKPSAVSQGAIHADGSTAMVVDDVELSYNEDTGIRLGKKGIIKNSWVHHNLVIGVGCYQCNGARVERDTIEFNPRTGISETGAFARASNVKMLRADSLVIRKNVVRDGLKKGIWIDHGYPPTTIDSNLIQRQVQSCIWHENGYKAVIRANVLQNCGTGGAGWIEGGLAVTNSPDVEIVGNTISGSANGIGIMQAAGYPNEIYGRNYMVNLWVHDNNVTMSSGRTGIVQNVGNDSVFTHWNNRFDRNTYTLGPSAPFAWRTNMNETQWTAAGNDRSGSFTR